MVRTPLTYPILRGYACDLAFLTDMSEKMNVLNKTLQGHMKMISELYSVVTEFQKALRLLINQFNVYIMVWYITLLCYIYNGMVY